MRMMLCIRTHILNFLLNSSHDCPKSLTNNSSMRWDSAYSAQLLWLNRKSEQTILLNHSKLLAVGLVPDWALPNSNSRGNKHRGILYQRQAPNLAWYRWSCSPSVPMSPLMLLQLEGQGLLSRNGPSFSRGNYNNASIYITWSGSYSIDLKF